MEAHYVKDCLINLELNSFMSSTTVSCYWVLKTKQLSSLIFVSFDGSSEERSRISPCLFCLAVLPGNYVGYHPDEIFSVFDEVFL